MVLAAAAGDDAEVDRAGGRWAWPSIRWRSDPIPGRGWSSRWDGRGAAGGSDAGRWACSQPALDRFRGLGARPWVEQVEREMSASGLRPARAPARVGTDLTPQEQAVAHLVGRGLTNREAAAELVVSAKTVEHHLSRVYAKLGVRSRTELVRRLDAVD